MRRIALAHLKGGIAAVLAIPVAEFA